MRLYTTVAVAAAAALGLWVGSNTNDSDIAIASADARVAGLSGLVVSPDGAGFTALGDRGVLVRGTLTRKDGVLVSARADSVEVLRDVMGEPIERGENDAEGLALTAKGDVVISFEGKVPRISRFDAKTREHVLSRFPEPGRMRGDNASLEALALDDRGRPVTLMEQPLQYRDRTEIYRLQDGKWTVIGYLMLSDGFLPVGAEFAPDGSLYVLERRFNFGGLRSRLRRVVLGDPVLSGQVVWAPEKSYGNLEGLSLWTDGDGSLRAVMVADNNQLPFLPKGLTEIVLAKKGAGE